MMSEIQCEPCYKYGHPEKILESSCVRYGCRSVEKLMVHNSITEYDKVVLLYKIVCLLLYSLKFPRETEPQDRFVARIAFLELLIRAPNSADSGVICGRLWGCVNGS